MTRLILRTLLQDIEKCYDKNENPFSKGAKHICHYLCKMTKHAFNQALPNSKTAFNLISASKLWQAWLIAKLSFLRKLWVVSKYIKWQIHTLTQICHILSQNSAQI